jgi:hypothetical protein
VRRCWLNALGATVNRFTGGITIGHFVMAITGRHILPGVCGDRAVKIDSGPPFLFPIPPENSSRSARDHERDVLPRLTVGQIRIS